MREQPHALLLTFQEVAAVANVSESTVKRWIASGELPRVKLGAKKPDRFRDNRPVRFRIRDVAEFLGITVEDVWRALATTESSDDTEEGE